VAPGAAALFGPAVTARGVCEWPAIAQSARALFRSKQGGVVLVAVLERADGWHGVTIRCDDTSSACDARTPLACAASVLD
jgi:hypothetical protein